MLLFGYRSTPADPYNRDWYSTRIIAVTFSFFCFIIYNVHSRDKKEHFTCILLLGIDCVGGLTTRQPLWVILYPLPEKREKRDRRDSR